jgi:transposase
MIIVPTGARVHVALGSTDMRKGMCGLSMLVQKVLAKDPFSGHMFVFRGKRANYIKILYWDGNGLCLFGKRLERGRFAWPTTTVSGGTVALTPAQLSMLIEGVDWRAPERTWRPELAG